MNPGGRSVLALVAAAINHLLFLAAVGSMAFSLATGMQHGLGRLPLAWAMPADLLLVLQFPIVHSWLLTRRGRRMLEAPFGAAVGATLRPTTFATVASLQLLLCFWAWTPSGIVWSAAGGTGTGHWLVFAAAWGVLLKAIWDGGPMLQTGAAGWWALLRGRRVDYGDLPTQGLFARCRQPIYLGFLLVLLTAPVWSADWSWLCAGWSAYCVLGPLRKEARFEAIFGQRFRDYRASVPYFVPRVGATRNQP